MGSRIEPDFDHETNVLSLPRSGYARYTVNGERAKGKVLVEEEVVVTAEAVAPARFRDGTVTEWIYSPGVAQESVDLDEVPQPEVPLIPVDPD